MIRHEITEEGLRAAILARSPGWHDRASKIMAGLPANPTTKQFVSLWGDIKEVYIDLQGEKCIYCETRIEGNVSNDVEHFRPKAKVAAWKVPAWMGRAGVTATSPATPKGDPGYRDLAYHPWNYAASCKFCNSVLKRNHFPISGPRLAAGNDPRRMKGEQPLLIYPIGDVDDDPATLIRFEGMHPEPAMTPERPGYARALVTIDLFALNDGVKRKALFNARAELLKLCHDQLEKRDQPRTIQERDEAVEWIEILQDSRSAHASCMRSFIARYEGDPSRAKRLVDEARVFRKRKS